MDKKTSEQKSEIHVDVWWGIQGDIRAPPFMCSVQSSEESGPDDDGNDESTSTVHVMETAGMARKEIEAKEKEMYCCEHFILRCETNLVIYYRLV